MKAISTNLLTFFTALLFLLAIAPPLYAEGSAPAASDYSGPSFFELHPNPNGESNFGSVGVTGLKLRVYPGVVLQVEEIMRGAPADGKFRKGEIITGVNGVELKGRNPYVLLGEALTKAEAADGTLLFDVLSSDGKEKKKVTVRIPVLGAYSTTWPLKCRKSQAIIKTAADYYAKNVTGGVEGALACLFLLSTGDDQYLPVVKSYFAKMASNVKGIGDCTWSNGYNGIACAEYYLRTGDRSVLPVLQYFCDDARDGQAYGVAWAHGSGRCNPNYMQGVLNAASVQVVTTLLLSKECGIQVDDATLLGALKYYYRFAGHGAVPYGEHRGEALGSNGKDGMAAAVMQIASGAKGDVSIYKQARNAFAMPMLDSYLCMISGHGDDGRGDAIWRGISAAWLMDLKPAAYRYHMDLVKWWFDLSRRPSGAFGLSSCQSFDEEASGTAAALAYTAPLKTLRITGAPRSQYAKEFTLPGVLWGRKADLDFLSVEHGTPYLTYGEDEPVHVPVLKFGGAHSKPSDADLAKIPRREVLKNVYHRNYTIRAQAAKALMRVGALDELEKLLQDNDPRVRRAALDGLTDFSFFSGAAGRGRIRPGKVTPGMLASFRKMLADPEEAIYVVDGALLALSCSPPPEIASSFSLIQPCTTYDEWWIRQSAFAALASAAEDDSVALKLLPVMGEMLWREDRAWARSVMSGRMSQLAKKYAPDSEPGKQISAIFKKAVDATRIDTGFRGGAGGFYVKDNFISGLDFDPRTYLELATSLGKRLSAIRTDYLVELTGKLLSILEKQPESKRQELTELLYGEYRQEFIRRMKAGDMQLDSIVSLTALKSRDAGWRVLGNPIAEREWRYMVFNPLPKDELDVRQGQRFRAVTLPEGMKNWSAPDFDDKAWKKGKAPIGVGRWTGALDAYGPGDDNNTYANRSDWGDGEFLVMRCEFSVDSLDYDFIRLRVLAKQGYQLCLNGHEIASRAWGSNTPGYSPIMLEPNARKHLKKGTNILAIHTVLQYWEGLPPFRRDKRENTPRMAQMDAYLEGLRKADLLGQPEKK